MPEQRSQRIFEILFSSTPQLRDIVRASPHEPLPRVREPEPPPPLPVVPDPARIAREERQTVEQVLAHLRSAADQLASRYDSMVGEMRQAAVELAVAVAGRVVFDKLQAGEFPIEEMVRRAVARLPASPIVSVVLHPDDRTLLQNRLGNEPLLSSNEPEIRIETDAALQRGGCRVEAGEIHVLADLAIQLAELRQHLLWSASHARSGSDAATT